MFRTAVSDKNQQPKLMLNRLRVGERDNVSSNHCEHRQIQNLQPYNCCEQFAPMGRILRIERRRATLAARIERFGTGFVTLLVSGRQQLEQGQILQAQFIIGTKGPVRLRLLVQSVADVAVELFGGIPAIRIIAQLLSPNRKLKTALGQYALQFGQIENCTPEPRSLIKAGLGPISLNEAIVLERPNIGQHKKFQEVAELRCKAFRELDDFSSDEMLDAWDTTPGIGQIVVARLRGRVVASMRSAYPTGQDNMLPLLTYMPHVKGKLPGNKIAEVGRKAGDRAFWYGDMFELLSAQVMRDGLVRGFDTMVASVQCHDIRRYERLGFSDTKLRGAFPTAIPRDCGVISINLKDLWTGRLGFVAWRVLAASAEENLPDGFVLKQTIRDRLRLFMFRRCNRLIAPSNPSMRKKKMRSIETAKEQKSN